MPIQHAVAHDTSEALAMPWPPSNLKDKPVGDELPTTAAICGNVAGTARRTARQWSSSHGSRWFNLAKIPWSCWGCEFVNIYLYPVIVHHQQSMKSPQGALSSIHANLSRYPLWWRWWSKSGRLARWENNRTLPNAFKNWFLSLNSCRSCQALFEH